MVATAAASPDPRAEKIAANVEEILGIYRERAKEDTPLGRYAQTRIAPLEAALARHRG